MGGCPKDSESLRGWEPSQLWGCARYFLCPTYLSPRRGEGPGTKELVLILSPLSHRCSQ